MKRPESDATLPPIARPLPRMMIAFVVRRCTIDLGHRPTPSEFAAWANAQGDDQSRLFGRAITEHEASVILKHQARLVSAKSARADEEYDPDADLPSPRGANVVTLADARQKAQSKRRAK